MPKMGSSKNFLGKNLRIYGSDKKIFDFTYHKLNKMLDDLWRNEPQHPDIMVLNNILELYIDGDIDIYWSEGYPMPFPADSNNIPLEFDEAIRRELINMGLHDEEDHY